MSNKIKWKAGTLLAPVPAVLVSCGTIDAPNAITIAWTGIVSSSPPKTYVSIRPNRFSYEIINKSGEFVINLTNQSLLKATDLCGVKSGRDINKFELCGLTAEKSFSVEAPSIAESPISIECKVSDVIKLGSHDMFLADIVTVAVDGSYIDEKGKLRLDKAGLIAYSHGEYFALGKKLGTFGYSVQKRSTERRKARRKD